MPVALCRIIFKMALDFQMTWVKKDNSLIVLRGNTWRFFNLFWEFCSFFVIGIGLECMACFLPLLGKAAPGICRYLGSRPSTLLGAKHMQTPGFLLIHLGWDPILKGLLSVGIGEGNGSPLQYSCLENPMDRGGWQATVRGVTKSQTQLSDWAHSVGMMMAQWAGVHPQRSLESVVQHFASVRSCRPFWRCIFM